MQCCRNDADAREVTQDTFVRAFQAIARFDAQGRFGPWLFTIARRKFYDHYRATMHRATLRAAADEPVPDLPDHNDPSELLARHEERQGLWELARRHLREAQFQALWLRYAEDMSVAGVARVLRKTETHVKVLLFRAREALGRELKAAKVSGGPSGLAACRTIPSLRTVSHRTRGEADGIGECRIVGFSRPVLTPEPAIAKKGVL
jgi:RNA polymerase sigma-70 factor (ECF subfamily)